MALLELRDVHTYYGNIHALKGIEPDRRAGRDRHPHRRQRRRQVDDAQDHQRRSSARAWARSGSTASASTGCPPTRSSTKGISQSPEGRRIFPKMSVRENLEMGAFQRTPGPELDADFERVFTLFPRLKERLAQNGGTLSGGEQQMLAIGRALMARPSSSSSTSRPWAWRRSSSSRSSTSSRTSTPTGTTVLLVEQNALMALGIARRGYILQTGEIVLEDVADKLIDQPRGPEGVPRRLTPAAPASAARSRWRPTFTRCRTPPPRTTPGCRARAVDEQPAALRVAAAAHPRPIARRGPRRPAGARRRCRPSRRRPSARCRPAREPEGDRGEGRVERRSRQASRVSAGRRPGRGRAARMARSRASCPARRAAPPGPGYACVAQELVGSAGVDQMVVRRLIRPRPAAVVGARAVRAVGESQRGLGAEPPCNGIHGH